jgi:hypothetical protein
MPDNPIDDFLHKQLDVSDNVRTSIDQGVQMVKGIIDTVKQAIAFVGFVESLFESVGEALGLIPGAVSALDSAVNKLEGYYDQLLHISEVSASMQNLAGIIGPVYGAFGELQKYVLNNKGADPSIPDPPWDQHADVETTTHNAPITLTSLDYTYFNRQFFPELVYSDGWIGVANPPGTPADMVFDYRLTLPVYIEAVTIRLVVLASLYKNAFELPGNRPEMENFWNSLSYIYNTIVGGIVELQPPALEQLMVTITTVPGDKPGSTVTNTFPSEWASRGGNLFGAVERYSMSSVVNSWPSDEKPASGMGLTPEDVASFSYPKFMIRHLLRTMACVKQVYISVGLCKTARLMRHVDQLMGNSLTLFSPPIGDWSLTELVDRLLAVPSSGLDDTNVPKLLIGRRLIKLSVVLPVLQTFNPVPYTSLRSALQQQPATLPLTTPPSDDNACGLGFL